MTRVTHIDETVTIGGDLTVGRIGYGAMQLTGPKVWGEYPDHDKGVALLREVVAAGVTFIDTADAYGPHSNEELIREALHPYPEQLVIATKGGFVRDGPEYTDMGAVGNPHYLRHAAQMSARRLGLDHIDLYYLHTPTMTDAPFEEIIETLAAMRQDGLIRHIGLSNVSADQLRTALAITDIAAVTVHYNVAVRLGAAVRQVAQDAGIVFSPWHPGAIPRGVRRDSSADRPRLAAAPHRAGAAHPRHHQHPAPQGEPRRRSHLTDARRGGRHHCACARRKLRSIDDDRQRSDDRESPTHRRPRASASG